MTLKTLRKMARGGIHDHIGGGFHRYSTDAVWHVPHFEKMLYDQAQLAVSYTEAYQITHDPFFADTVRDILEFVLRDMRAPEGGFYSALDADSLIEPGKPKHGEGAFYVWEAKEIEPVLGPDTAAVFDYRYGVEPNGNVPAEQDFQGEFKKKNILFERHSGRNRSALRQAGSCDPRDARRSPAQALRRARPTPTPAARRQSSNCVERPDDLRLRPRRPGAG